MTGAARGIGAAIAERLGAAGAVVLVGDVDEAAAEQQVRRMHAKGFSAEALALDVASEASVESACAYIERRFGHLDILVNNAGVLGLDEGRRPEVATMPVALWRRTLDVNLTGTFLMCRGAAPLMQRNRWGRIVNMSSRVGRTKTGPGNAHYAASKAGLIGFSRVLASELGAYGITVNCIAPSKVATAMTQALQDSDGRLAANVAETAVGRLGTVGDVAGVVAFLASDDAAFVTGIVVDVTGGSYMP